MHGGGRAVVAVGVDFRMSGEQRFELALLLLAALPPACEWPTQSQQQVPLDQLSAEVLRAEDIAIIVAGGPGTHSVYVPTFGQTRAVSRRITP